MLLSQLKSHAQVEIVIVDQAMPKARAKVNANPNCSHLRKARIKAEAMVKAKAT